MKTFLLSLCLMSAVNLGSEEQHAANHLMVIWGKYAEATVLMTHSLDQPFKRVARINGVSIVLGEYVFPPPIFIRVEAESGEPLKVHIVPFYYP